MLLHYKANMAGPYHIENGIVCQDSYAVREGKNGEMIVAVADGLGSELYSDVGSQVGVNRAVDYCAEKLTPEMSVDEIKKMISNSFVHAYAAILERAEEDKQDSNQYDTTLCLAIYDGSHVVYGQSGDSGMIAVLESGEYVQLTQQQRDEEGYVYPLCSGPEFWQFGQEEGPVSALMVMTDGVFEQICPPILKKKEQTINVALAKDFLDREEKTPEEAKELDEALDEFLKNYPEELLNDDKTAVIVFNTERPAKRLEESYYAPLDWEKLNAEKEKILYQPKEEPESPKPQAPEDIWEEETVQEEPEAEPAPEAETESEPEPDKPSQPPQEPKVEDDLEEQVRRIVQKNPYFWLFMHSIVPIKDLDMLKALEAKVSAEGYCRACCAGSMMKMLYFIGLGVLAGMF